MSDEIVRDEINHRHDTMHHDSGAAAQALAAVEMVNRISKGRRQWHRSQLYVVGRLILAALFIASGLAKIVYFSATEQRMLDVGLNDTALLIRVAIGVELLGGLMLAVGYRGRTVAVGLIAYLASVTVLAHHDFTLEINRVYALASLAFTGGLTMVIAHGSGVLSADRYLEHRRSQRLSV